MKNLRWRLTLFIVSVIIASCGSDTAFFSDDAEDAKNFRLISAEEYFSDNSSEDRSVEIIYNDENKKEYKEMDDFVIQYLYSSVNSKNTYTGESFAAADADGLCTLVLDENRVVEKKFSLIDNSKNSIPEKTVLFFYDDFNNIVKEQHIDAESNVELDVFYRYAYSNSGEDDFVLIEKHYVSNEDDVKAYYRYPSGSKKPVSIEYDINGDYNIDYITEIQYDEYNNPVVADNKKYTESGSKRAVSKVVYVWEEGDASGEEDDLTQLWDDNDSSFLQQFR